MHLKSCATGAAMLALLAAMPPAAAAAAVAGTGQGSTFTFCDPSVDIAMAGASADGAAWTFQLTMLRTPAGGCTPIIPGAFAGAWSPAAGGCMASLAPQLPGQLCVDPVALPGPGATGWRICALTTNPCVDFQAFWVGTVTLAGA